MMVRVKCPKDYSIWLNVGEGYVSVQHRLLGFMHGDIELPSVCKCLSLLECPWCWQGRLNPMCRLDLRLKDDATPVAKSETTRRKAFAVIARVKIVV